MIRIVDFTLSLLGCILLFPVASLLFFLVFFDTGRPLFCQRRVGRYKRPFVLMKFRTMRIGTEEVATHLADKASVTVIGSFLRRTKLDELPQLINVLKGDMSIVGARPNLYSQLELIKERDKRGVYNFRPGITGLSQIREIDMSTPALLADTDADMYRSFGIIVYFKYIILTIFGRGQGDRILK